MAHIDSPPRSEEAPLTTRQAAVRLGVHERTVRRYIASGLLGYRRLPSGHYRIPADAIRVFWDRTDDVSARSSSNGASVDRLRVANASSHPDARQTHARGAHRYDLSPRALAELRARLS
jgi:excisionase family DNA binding protein